MLDLIKSAARRSAATRSAKQLGGSFEQLKFAAAKLDKVDELEFGRVFAMLGDVIFSKAGSTGSFEQTLYNRLWADSSWSPAHDMLVSPVRTVLGRMQTKQAKNPLPAAGMAAFLNGGNALQLLGALVGTGALAGSGLGALNWHLKRDTEEDDQKNEELAAKAQFFRDTARQIQEEMRMRQIQPRGAGSHGYAG